jgi:hypothetical protein
MVSWKMRPSALGSRAATSSQRGEKAFAIEDVAPPAISRRVRIPPRAMMAYKVALSGGR